MKRSISLLLLILCAHFSFASNPKLQKEHRYGDRGHFGTIKTSFVMWNPDAGSPYSEYGVEIDLINGYAFNPYFMLGGGVGVDFKWEKPATGQKRDLMTFIPIYAHIRCNILDRRLTPVIALNIGGAALADDDKVQWGGWCVEPLAGIAVRLKNGKSIDLTASLHVQGGIFLGWDIGHKIGVSYTW